MPEVPMRAFLAGGEDAGTPGVFCEELPPVPHRTRWSVDVAALSSERILCFVDDNASQQSSP